MGHLIDFDNADSPLPSQRIQVTLKGIRFAVPLETIPNQVSFCRGAVGLQRDSTIFACSALCRSPKIARAESKQYAHAASAASRCSRRMWSDLSSKA
jgi:hypothetical protein